MLGVEACIAFSGARVGLYHALQSCNFPVDSGVLMTPITTAEMVRAVRRAGLRPVLAEMNPETLFYDTRALRDAIRRNTRAIVLTYLYGLVPPTLDDVLALARERGLVVIEDVSQALGASFGDRFLGTLGDFGLASLSSFKVVSSLGGGLLFGRNARVEPCRAVAPSAARPPDRRPLLTLVAKVLAHRALTSDPVYPLVFPAVRALTQHAPDLLDRVQTGNLGLILGRNSTPASPQASDDFEVAYTDFQARMALAALSRLHDVNQALARQAGLLASARGVEARLPARHPEGRHVWWRFPVRVSDARAVARRLATLGVESSRNALPICSEIPAFAPFVVRGPLLGARACHEQWLLVPVHADHDACTVAAVREALVAALEADPLPGRDP